MLPWQHLHYTRHRGCMLVGAETTVTVQWVFPKIGLILICTTLTYHSPHPPVEGIFDVWSVVLNPMELHGVGLILCPQQWRLLPIWVRTHVEMILPQRLVLPLHVPLPHLFQHRLPRAPLMFTAPDPRVAIPQCREQVKTSGLRTTVADSDANQHVHWTCLGVLCEHIPIFPLFKHTGIFELKLRIMHTAPSILLHQPCIGVLCLWILVQRLHVGMGGGRVQIVVTLLGIFAVVPLTPRQPKDSLFKDGVPLVPECKGKT